MSERYCYDLWQSCLNELQKLLNENTSSSQDKDHLAKAYLRYLQVLKQLNEVHTYIRQPQHREAVATSLLCCSALLTESWSALVTANKGIDVIDFGSYLLELQLTPDDLEVPVPAVLKASDRIGQAKLKEALAAAEASTVPATSRSPSEEPFVATINKSTKKLPTKSTYSKALPPDASAESTISPDEAATKIQSAWRGWRDRQSAADIRCKEYEYVGMTKSRNDNVSSDIHSSVNFEEGAVARRERRRREYEQARLEIEELLELQESPLMELEETNQIHSWLEEKIKNEGEQWPEVPLDGELSAAVQNNTPSSENQTPKSKSRKPKSASSAGDGAASLAPGKARKLGAGSGSTVSSTNANEASKSSAVPTFASQLEELIKEWKVSEEENLADEQEQQGVSGIATDTATADADTDDATYISDEPLSALEGLPVPRRGSSIDAIDFKLLTTSTRPRIKQKVRSTVRERARQTAAAANAARPAPQAAKQKQTTPGAKSSSKVSAPTSKKPVEKPTKKNSKPGTGNKEDKEPKRGPLPPPRDLEEIFKELAEQQIALKCPEMNLDRFIGTYCLVPGSSATGDSQPVPVLKAKSGGKAANIAAKTSEPLVYYPELSSAQIRQLLTVKCAFPLAIQGSNADPDLKVQMAHSMSCPITALIYGPQGSGKTMLVHAIAHESKASLFDLSPKNLAGKYPGQQAIDVAVQSVFAAAKAAAPAIIYFDKIEQLFIRDEKRVAQLAEETGGEPVGRIRRQMLIEIAALKPEDGVLVLCTSQEPQACVRADEASFISFFQFFVNIPLPDDLCRRALLEEVAVELKWSDFWTAQQLNLAARLTQGYTAGQLKCIMSRSLDLFRASNGDKVDILDSFIEATAVEVKIESAELQKVAEWTARAHAMLTNSSKTAASSK